MPPAFTVSATTTLEGCRHLEHHPRSSRLLCLWAGRGSSSAAAYANACCSRSTAQSSAFVGRACFGFRAAERGRLSRWLEGAQVDRRPPVCSWLPMRSCRCRRSRRCCWPTGPTIVIFFQPELRGTLSRFGRHGRRVDPCRGGVGPPSRRQVGSSPGVAETPSSSMHSRAECPMRSMQGTQACLKPREPSQRWLHRIAPVCGDSCRCSSTLNFSAPTPAT